jgi:hypothetical protein
MKKLEVDLTDEEWQILSQSTIALGGQISLPEGIKMMAKQMLKASKQTREEILAQIEADEERLRNE